MARDIMTHRERIWAAIRGEPMDRIPWVPRWELWYEAAKSDGRLPETYRDRSFFDVTRDLRMGIKGNRGPLHRSEIRDVTVRVRTKGDETLTEYDTPVGTVSTRFRITPDLERQGVRGLELGHMIERREDYGPVLFMVEHTHIVPAHEEFLAYEEAVGEDGVAMAESGDSPLHRIMREFTGYQNFYYELYDHPHEVEELRQALTEQGERILQIAVASPARIIRHDGNYDTQLTPPPVYEKYFLPWFQHFTDTLHAAGKVVCTHTDGHNDGLMDLILASGFDIAEAFTPPPMTNIGVAQARALWGDRITIWGGIASTMMSLSVPEEKFEAHIRQVLKEAAPGDHFILGTGDNVPTDSSLERVRRVTELVEDLGSYPLEEERL
jgi:uroporphyrinogen-III decarboxylase